MNPTNPTQKPNPEDKMDKDQLAATLANINYVMTQKQIQNNQMFAPNEQQGQQTAPQTPQEATQQTQPEKPQDPQKQDPAEAIKGVEERLTKLIGELEKSLQNKQTDEMKKEMGEIKQTLKDLAQ